MFDKVFPGILFDSDRIFKNVLRSSENRILNNNKQKDSMNKLKSQMKILLEKDGKVTKVIVFIKTSLE